MKAKVYIINKNQCGQYFGLLFWDGEEWRVSYIAPNNWKTEKGAKKWALNHGYEFEEASK